MHNNQKEQRKKKLNESFSSLQCVYPNEGAINKYVFCKIRKWRRWKWVYFLCNGDDGIVIRVKHSPPLMKAYEFFFDFEHEIVGNVVDNESAIGDAHKLSNNGNINGIWDAVLRADYRIRSGIYFWTCLCKYWLMWIWLPHYVSFNSVLFFSLKILRFGYVYVYEENQK